MKMWLPSARLIKAIRPNQLRVRCSKRPDRKSKNSRCFRSESLEPRQLLSTVLSYQSPQGNGADDLTLRLNSLTRNLEVVNTASGAVLAAANLDVTDAVQITGAANEDDKLTIDFGSSGFFSVPNGISFDGGANAFDSIAIAGSGVESVRYSPSSLASGAGTFAAKVQSQTALVNFIGLEPVTVSGLASFTFYTPNDEDVLLVDAPDGQNR